MSPKQPKSAKIIAVFNDKGGAGKTTTACQLAGTVGHKGLDVLVADLCGSGAAAKWLAANGGQHFPGTLWVGHLYGSNTASELGKLASKYDVILADCAPAVDNPATWAALLVCDMAIIPTKLQPTDLGALPSAIQLARRAQQESGRDFDVLVLPTAVRKRPDDALALKAVEQLCQTFSKNMSGLKLSKHSLGDRIAFTRSANFGATAHSLPNSKDAVGEIEAIAADVMKAIKIQARKS